MYSFARAEPPNKAKEPGAFRAAVQAAPRVRLCTDFKHIQRQQGDFADTDETARRRVHHRLGIPFPKRVFKETRVLCRHKVLHDGLATKFIDTLRDFVARRKAQTRKEGAIARKHGLLIRITKNDLIQNREAMHLDSCNVSKTTDMVSVSLTLVKTHGIFVGHETFRDRVDGVKDHELT
ncbi:hypothetical protein PsorP6_007299 [Peronosclerospora sorghi]|uniref:Uncharacterized protein n=1 Tax=Peronosclerospora sorghi TaxID=230839 RepID=A0ACC0W922_9STRA|nr:hypothetical protein PsorP6_007299 [Peronosclerospora sorghi]